MSRQKCRAIVIISTMGHKSSEVKRHPKPHPDTIVSQFSPLAEFLLDFTVGRGRAMRYSQQIRLHFIIDIANLA